MFSTTTIRRVAIPLVTYLFEPCGLLVSTLFETRVLNIACSSQRLVNYLGFDSPSRNGSGRPILQKGMFSAVTQTSCSHIWRAKKSSQCSVRDIENAKFHCWTDLKIPFGAKSLMKHTNLLAKRKSSKPFTNNVGTPSSQHSNLVHESWQGWAEDIRQPWRASDHAQHHTRFVIVPCHSIHAEPNTIQGDHVVAGRRDLPAQLGNLSGHGRLASGRL